jgi:hypothetical protein
MHGVMPARFGMMLFSVTGMTMSAVGVMVMFDVFVIAHFCSPGSCV